ncbi:MAG: S-methyl-5-thioribose-1-phosphate isomerase [Gammaproteobacteria bacterium]|nr:S-methyl-5-thioribose-1-phosphate isomerase [Gammaproteobacteria bacterium]MDH3406336.1 S-methyl-5-thioribose-1-phosphate isomerase [Gammaproteobacteria bacterium]
MSTPAPQVKEIPYDKIRAVEWETGRLKLIDQRILPARLEHLYLDHLLDAAYAITDMVVRGAPAIGVTAAYAVVLAARDRYQENPNGWQKAIQPDLELLALARPTAVNLRWAVGQMRGVIYSGIVGDPVPRLLSEAQRIHAEDIAANRRMGELGAALIAKDSGVLTHCNTGALATGGYGTALGVVRAGFAAEKIKKVFADETRPWLQGARLTAWELVQEGIPVTLIADSAATYLMKQGKVAWVIVGADRIAANGDTANKIGTYMTAVAARYHKVKFMVVAPTSTVDMNTPDGSKIPIETRAEAEVLNFGGTRTAPEGVQAWNPAFDITPAELIDAIVTEKGVVEKPTREKLAALMKKVKN